VPDGAVGTVPDGCHDFSRTANQEWRDLTLGLPQCLWNATSVTHFASHFEGPPGEIK
jgi:hypothetical protein